MLTLRATIAIIAAMLILFSLSCLLMPLPFFAFADAARCRCRHFRDIFILMPFSSPFRHYCRHYFQRHAAA